MRTLYIDCGMGAAGDMLSAALLELFPQPDRMMDRLNALGLPGGCYVKETAVKCGITGTHISVKVHGMEEQSHDAECAHDHAHGHSHTYDDVQEYEYAHDDAQGNAHVHDDAQGQGNEHDHAHTHPHAHSHVHTGMQEIERIVREQLSVSEKVKGDVLAVYGLLADAESRVHGVPVSEIHFHEVGTMDALADITAVCLMMEELAPQQVIVSPVHVGSGQVRCAHGILPVPAPATACLLEGVPVYGGSIRGELCTPTGAALLKYFATTFGEMPTMTLQRIGYGCGKKDFEAANCVRAMLGETQDQGDLIAELSCNLDDMTAEAVGYATEVLFAAGAKEVYTVSIGMKKSRPGLLLCVMCRLEDREEMIRLIFRHTTTLGIREQISRRYTLKREMETVDTAYGPMRRKVSSGYGISREKYEYEDLAKAARREGLSLSEVRDALNSK